MTEQANWVIAGALSWLASRVAKRPRSFHGACNGILGFQRFRLAAALGVLATYVATSTCTRMDCGIVSDTSFRAVHETDWSTEGRKWMDKTRKRENRQLTSTAIRRGAAPPIFFSFLDWMDGIRR